MKLKVFFLILIFLIQPQIALCSEFDPALEKQEMNLTIEDVNPLGDLFNFLCYAPYSKISSTLSNSLDDLVEDATKSFLIGSYLFASFHIYCYSKRMGIGSMLLFPAVYLQANEHADDLGDRVYRNAYGKEKVHRQQKNFLVKFSNDITEDSFKVLCYSWEYTRGVAPGLALWTALRSQTAQTLIAPLTRPFLSQESLALASSTLSSLLIGLDVYLGLAETLGKYKSCEELGDLYGAWVANNLDKLFS